VGARSERSSGSTECSIIIVYQGAKSFRVSALVHEPMIARARFSVSATRRRPNTSPLKTVEASPPLPRAISSMRATMSLSGRVALRAEHEGGEVLRRRDRGDGRRHRRLELYVRVGQGSLRACEHGGRESGHVEPEAGHHLGVELPAIPAHDHVGDSLGDGVADVGGHRLAGASAGDPQRVLRGSRQRRGRCSERVGSAAEGLADQPVEAIGQLVEVPRSPGRDVANRGRDRRAA